MIYVYQDDGYWSVDQARTSASLTTSNSYCVLLRTCRGSVVVHDCRLRRPAALDLVKRIVCLGDGTRLSIRCGVLCDAGGMPLLCVPVPTRIPSGV